MNTKEVTYKGKKMLVYEGSAQDHYVSYMISTGREWEPHVSKFIDDHNIGGVLLDIGGDIGTFSIENQEKFDIIYTFEPSLERATIIKKSVDQFGYDNIRVVNKAVGAIAGRGTLKTVYQNQLEVQDDGDVDIIAIDELGIEPVDFIKIDTEGFEDQVVLGMNKLLHNHNPYLFIETHSVYRMESLTDTNKILDELGYTKIKAFECEGGIYKKI